MRIMPNASARPKSLAGTCFSSGIETKHKQKRMWFGKICEIETVAGQLQRP
jgi:hypothetical protein